jgi:hypothetical protein
MQKLYPKVCGKISAEILAKQNCTVYAHPLCRRPCALPKLVGEIDFWDTVEILQAH